MRCTLCPRRCGVDRPEHARPGQGPGRCAMGWNPVLARAALHTWEEPCISGNRGSGTVFFSGCGLQCVYCQNAAISHDHFGREISVEQLRQVFFDLIGQGAHNINLVNPTHFVPAISRAIGDGLPVPVVYNSSGYERLETLRLLEGKVDVYLPDLKYSDNALAARLSDAPDYVEAATAAIAEMVRQCGGCQYDDDGILTHGVIIRHLVLPGQLENTFNVIDYVSEHYPDQVLFSLMSQYIHCGRADQFPDINRVLTADEIETAVHYFGMSDIEEGFIQQSESAQALYIPPFDLEGVPHSPSL